MRVAIATVLLVALVAGTALAQEDIRLVEEAIADLEKITAYVWVELVTEGATIEIDGRDVTGQAVQGPVEVDPGAHMIKASKAGYATMEQEIILSKSEHRTVSSRAGTRTRSTGATRMRASPSARTARRSATPPPRSWSWPASRSRARWWPGSRPIRSARRRSSQGPLPCRSLPSRSRAAACW